MTVYCYRCGRDIEVEPKVKDIRIWDDKTVRIAFEESVVKHTCPQDER